MKPRKIDIDFEKEVKIIYKKLTIFMKRKGITQEDIDSAFSYLIADSAEYLFGKYDFLKYDLTLRYVKDKLRKRVNDLII